MLLKVKEEFPINGLQMKEQTITSMEVAEMIEKEHKYLMRNIRRYTNVMTGAEIAPVEFWIESTYVDKKKETRPCYDITKKGCEFIAHKIKGDKGIVFTAQYINRFHDMENEIKGKLFGNMKEIFPEIPKVVYNTSSTPVPKNPSWYCRNRRRMLLIAEKSNAPVSQLYHFILLRLGEEYDLNAANQIFEVEQGRPLTYALDIVSYFPELARMADLYLDKLEMGIVHKAGNK